MNDSDKKRLSKSGTFSTHIALRKFPINVPPAMSKADGETIPVRKGGEEGGGRRENGGWKESRCRITAHRIRAPNLAGLAGPSKSKVLMGDK